MNERKSLFLIIILYCMLVFAILWGANLADKMRIKDDAYQMEISEFQRQLQHLSLHRFVCYQTRSGMTSV